MIILLVIVFDPLAIMMVLAATQSLKWRRESKTAYEPDDEPLTEQQVEQLKQTVAQFAPVGETVTKQELFPEPEKSILEQHPYLSKPFATFENLQPMVAPAENKPVETAPVPAETTVPEDVEADPDADDPEDTSIIAQCKRLWKQDHPGMTLKEQRRLVAAGKLDHEPWQDYINDPRINRETSFGTDLPLSGARGDTFVLTSVIPTALFKHNGDRWIAIDKRFTDQYVYNTAYIDYLIEQIGLGTYDTDLLSDAEQAQISLRLSQEK